MIEIIKIALSQISGETVNDFTTMVTYEITAEDGSNKFYNVYVTSTSDLILNSVVPLKKEAARNAVPINKFIMCFLV